MIGQTGAVSDCIEHYHDFIILKCFDLPLTRFRDFDRIKSVSDIALDDPVSVKLFEHYGDRRLFPGKRSVAVLIDSHCFSVIYHVFAAVIYEQVDIRCFDLIQLIGLDVLRGFSLRQISFIDKIVEKELHIMKISPSRHRKNVAFQKRKIGTQKRRQLLLDILAFHIYVVFLFDDVVRFSALVMRFQVPAFFRCLHCMFRSA